ncbi:MAG: extracellular solute-binding protein, partial [Lachnospiraceae bacterium]|nr:extracellular solute-binding protein [Lachnospiraceae bacterium]
TYIGFPGMGGNGALIQSNGLSFAITSQSKYKDGAWQFIRYFLGEEYQTSVGLHVSAAQFPVKLSVLEQQAENATKPISADGRDEDGVFTVPGLSKARADELVAYLKSLNQTGRMDWEVYNIVIEEAGAYFAGQKTVQDVAKTIQGRVWIYLAEQQ